MKRVSRTIGMALDALSYIQPAEWTRFALIHVRPGRSFNVFRFLKQRRLIEVDTVGSFDPTTATSTHDLWRLTEAGREALKLWRDENGWERHPPVASATNRAIL